MARQETFYERTLDRTPYHACAWVGIAVAIIFAAGVVVLWRSAGYWKHHVKLPTAQSTHVNTDAVFNTIQDQVNDQKQKAVDAATKAAEDAAKAEGQRQINQQKSQYQQYLKK